MFRGGVGGNDGTYDGTSAIAVAASVERRARAAMMFRCGESEHAWEDVCRVGHFFIIFYILAFS